MLRQQVKALWSWPWNVRLYLLAEALASLSAGAFGAVYNLYILSLGYDAQFLGVLLAVAMAGAGVAAVPAGTLVDRWGARAVLLGASLVAAAGTGAQLVTGQAVVLAVGSAAAGAGGAAFYVAAAPFLARNALPERRSDLFSVDTVVSLAGMAAGSAIAGQLAATLVGDGAATLAFAGIWESGADRGRWGYWVTLLCAGAVGSCSFLPLLVTRDTAVISQGMAAAPVVAVGEARGSVRAESGAARGAHVPPDGAPDGSPSWRLALADSVAVRLAAVMGLIGLGAGLFLPFLNAYFAQELGAGPALYGWLSAAGTFGRLLATLAAPRLAVRWGAVRLIAATQLTSVPLLLLLGFAPHLGVACVAFLLRGAVMNMAAPVQASFSIEAVRPGIRGASTSLSWLAANGARGVSTMTGGALITATGYRLPYLLTAGLYVASAVLFLRWFSDRAEEDQEASKR